MEKNTHTNKHTYTFPCQASLPLPVFQPEIPYLFIQGSRLYWEAWVKLKSDVIDALLREIRKSKIHTRRQLWLIFRGRSCLHGSTAAKVSAMADIKRLLPPQVCIKSSV